MDNLIQKDLFDLKTNEYEEYIKMMKNSDKVILDFDSFKSDTNKQQTPRTSLINFLSS